MPADYFQSSGAIPLEREYEAWITDAIDRYFLITRRKAVLFAVSSADEVNWPADEVLATEGKVVGIQFKAPKLSQSKSLAPNDPARLYWSLHQPPGQFKLVKRYPEIFYCLPTFANRRYRHVALDHCLFWRPPNNSMMAWYNNPSPRVRTENVKLVGERRWGYFVEQLLYCSIGKLYTLVQFRSFVTGLRQEMLALREEPGERARRRQSGYRLHLLYVEVG